ncbi:glycosyltransferase [Cupriavidus sp. 2MCAB6]|uniref:glycosyltransferase n=1 Tax=Cupriavidus sp. 2MCAB6 TaxID=3232981 RepID=UPI003F8E483B
MNILHVTPTLNPATEDVSAYVSQFCLQLESMGHTCNVITLDSSKEARHWPPDISWEAVVDKNSKFGFYSDLWHLLSRRAAAADVVLIHGLWQLHSIISGHICRSLGVPYYVFPHSTLDPIINKKYPLKYIKKIIYWLAFECKNLNSANDIFFTNPEEQRKGITAFPFTKFQGKIVPTGIKNSAKDLEQLADSLAQHRPNGTHARRLLFLGRLHEKNGCDILIDGFSRALSSVEDIELVFAGPGPEEYIKELRVRADAGAGLGRIHFTGLVEGDEKWGLLSSAYAFILPSHQENYGLAIAEALAASIPVIITNQVDIWREIQSSGGGIVSSDDAEGVCSAIIRMMLLPREDWIAMRNSARRCFDRNFDISAAACRLIEAMD